MAHVPTKRTEEEAQLKGYPCHWCINSNVMPDENDICWRDGFCRKCAKASVDDKPSEFYLRKVG